VKLNDDYLIDLPPGHRQTSPLGDTGERSMDIANEEAILAELRALAPEATEGRIADHYAYSFKIAEEGDWYRVGDRVVYRCPLDDEAFKAALRLGTSGYVEGTDERVCPVLDTLIDIERQLANYPVLDEERYDELVRAHWVEEIRSCAPPRRDGRIGRIALTEAQATRIYYALMQNSWPPDDPNEEGVAAKYQVEFVGDVDYAIHGNSGTHVPGEGWKGPEKYIDLDDCVKHACRVLKIWPHWARRR
jgi:hypothetical protein